MNKVRIALAGCGQIADAHLAEIRKIDSAELVAVCDVYRDLAEQAAARFGVPRTFDDFDALLASGVADVVHIATPAHTHCSLAIRALQAGLHVYVEKPFTVDVDEADAVLAAAEKSGRMVCVGHNQLYDPAWQACRQLVTSGQLGEVVHVESTLGYDLSGPFGRLVASNPNHWVRRLPGGLVQNVISHPLYRITDFLPDEQPRVLATLREDLAATSPVCEFRAILEGERVTGSLVFSSSISPRQQLTRVWGTRQAVEVDLDGQILRPYRPVTMRGPFIKLQIPLRDLRAARKSFRSNLWRFLRGDLQYFAGMKTLFSQFYGAILQGGPPPIAYGEIRRVTAIIDALFASCRNAPARELASSEAT